MTVLASAELIGLERTYAIVERAIGRELRQAEKAVDVIALDSALNRAKDQLDEAIRAEMLAATMAWVSGMAIAPALRVTEEMIAPLDALYNLGRLEGGRELERLGYRGVVLPEFEERRYVADPRPLDRNLRGYLRRNLGGLSVRIEDELLHAELGSASRNAIIEALYNVPGSRDIASRIISTALIDGLGQTFDQNQGLIKCWEYTAVLDAGTCARCAPLDGKKFGSLEALYAVLPNFGPNPLCLGGGRCRCRALPCHVDEAGQHEPDAAPAPAPESDEGLPAWRRELEAIRGRDFLDPKGASEGELLTRGATALRKGPVDDFGFASSEVIPGARLIEDEAAILRAGEIVSDEMAARLGSKTADLRGTMEATQARLEPLRADYKMRRELYHQALSETNAAERDLAAKLRLQWLAENPGSGDYVEALRFVRTHPETKALEAAHKERLLELLRSANGPMTEISTLRQELRGLEDRIHTIERETLFELLGELREMGLGDLPGWEYTTSGRRGQAKQILDKAADLFPRDWIERGRTSPLKASWRKNGRGYHRGGSNFSEIVVSGGDRSKIAADPDGFATAIHELGHHVEHVDPRARLLQWAFYQRRTRASGYGIQEREIRFPRGAGYRSDETYRKDAFEVDYMGKGYTNRPTSHYALLTMGIEGLWTGSYRLDPEMRRFILGLLAVL